VVVRAELVVSDHPVCGAKEGFAEISWCRSLPSSWGGEFAKLDSCASTKRTTWF